MATQLYIAKSGSRNAPTLPLDAVTRTFAILGQRGTGKTSTGVVMVEEMARKGGHVVILDPVGVHYGITRAGAKKGIAGIVLGGEHGDVPLEETGGQLVADLVSGRHWPVVVIDLKLLRKGAQLRFMADFLEGVYHANREPLHVVFEEADRALPQTPRGMDPTLGRVLGAGEDIVKLGRSRGLGATLITQRPATLNKNVLEVCESLILHRLMGPNDRRAVKLWVEANGDERALKQVMDSMASLALGEAWLYSPGWLRLLERIRVRERGTFDSSATPEVGAQVVEPTERAPVDLDVLRQMMAETVERAERRDPKTLAKRVEELERQLEEQPEPEKMLVPDREAMVELSQAVAGAQVLLDELREAEAEQRAREAAWIERIESQRQVWAGVVGAAVEVLDGVAALPREGMPALAQDPPPEPRPGPHGKKRLAEMERQERADAEIARRQAGREASNGDGPSPGALALAGVLASVYPLWMTRGQLAILAKRGKKSSTLTQDIAALKGAGLIEDDRGRLRAAGSEVEGRRPPTLRELREQIDAVLPEGPRALYRVLLDGEELTRAELFERAGFSPTSSTPVGHLKLLTDNGIAERVKGGVGLGPLVS